MMKVVDGHNAVLGRLASIVAKSLMKGEEIAIVNAEKIIVTGNPKDIVSKYVAMRGIGNPHHGPFYPRQPEAIVRRTVRGMMPYKTTKGRTAMKKLHIYTGIPESLKEEKLDTMAVKNIRSNYIRVGEIAKTIGWKEKSKSTLRET
jgi:large subunit ribosomal protein L13